jgi:hypothetical protein
MAIVPIDKIKHADKGWAPFKNMNFAREIPIVPVTVSEFPRLALSMPIILIKVKQNYYFSTMMSIENNKNVFITDNGKWAGTYIPAFLRAYPFSLQKSEDGKSILCIEDKFISVLRDSEGESFFSADGEATTKLKLVFTFLERKEYDRQRTNTICELLKEFKLIEPAKTSIDLPSGVKTLDGYCQINEQKFNELEDKEFLKFRKTGLLPSCYLHLLSLCHWGSLGKLHEGHRSSEQAMKTLGSEIFNLSSEGDLNFDGL